MPAMNRITIQIDNYKPENKNAGPIVRKALHDTSALNVWSMSKGHPKTLELTITARGFYPINADLLLPHEIATALANELGVPVRYVVDQVVTDVVTPA